MWLAWWRSGQHGVGLGQNDRGQLGNGTTVSTMTPVKVTGLSQVTGIAAGYNAAVATATSGVSAATSVWTWGAAGSGITQLSAGWSHMLALKSNGTVLAWGSNQVGQLGNGTRDSVTGPVQVTGLTAATQVAAGGRGFSLAVHTVPYLVGL